MASKKYLKHKVQTWNITLQRFHFSIKLFMKPFLQPPQVWHVSSLITREGAISLNSGLINPRSHSIRHLAYFVSKAVYSVNKQRLYSAINHDERDVSWVVRTRHFYRAHGVKHMASTKHTYFHVGNQSPGRLQALCLTHRKCNRPSALKQNHKPPTRLNCSRAYSMNQPLL